MFYPSIDKSPHKDSHKMTLDAVFRPDLKRAIVYDTSIKEVPIFIDNVRKSRNIRGQNRSPLSRLL